MTPVALHDWALRWGLSPQCMAELMLCLGVVDKPHIPADAPFQASEQWTQTTITLEAPQFGVWLTRNNVGALLDKRGVPVRYGLANESKERNAVLKSGDLIGFRPVLITAQMVGQTIGQFVSRECKRPGWRYNPNDKHEAAQMNWALLVQKYGGDAKFATGPGSFAF